jgi:16S rRNA (cytosine1402-N4)-methyltransferase
MISVHKPVLLNEVLENLNPQAGQNFIDGTFGGGGHSSEILKKIGSSGKLLAIDANSEAEKLKSDNKNFRLVIDNFKNLEQIVADNLDFFNHPKGSEKFINGILLDLGLSSDELDISGRGFTFQKDEPLDMRFDINSQTTATEILKSYSLGKLIDIFKNLGDYPKAKQLAEEIVKIRKIKSIETTFELVNLILSTTPRRKFDKIHPATKVFQALRIAVNSELDNLISVLPQCLELLALKGRLAIISFHSGEDKIVKHFFRNESEFENPRIKLITKKPIVPTEEEIEKNPRARSAKLRVIEKI